MGLHARQFQAGGIAAWEEFETAARIALSASRGPGAEEEGLEKQRQLEERYFSADALAKYRALTGDMISGEAEMARDGFRIFRLRHPCRTVDEHSRPLSGDGREGPARRLGAIGRTSIAAPDGSPTPRRSAITSAVSAAALPRRRRPATWPAFTGANASAALAAGRRRSGRADRRHGSRGVDVNLTLPSGWFGTWTAGDDVALEMAMYRAYHRWMADYCGAFPERLGGVILASAPRHRG